MYIYVCREWGGVREACVHAQYVYVHVQSCVCVCVPCVCVCVCVCVYHVCVCVFHMLYTVWIAKANVAFDTDST